MGHGGRGAWGQGSHGRGGRSGRSDLLIELSSAWGQTMGPGAMGPWGEAERGGRAERAGSPLKSAERARAAGPGAMGPWAMGPGKPWARARARARGNLVDVMAFKSGFNLQKDVKTRDL